MQDMGNDQTLSERKAVLETSAPITDHTLPRSASNHHPLIDQVSNSWRNEKSTYLEHVESGHDLDAEDEASCAKSACEALVSRRFRKMMLVALLFVAVGCWIWSWYLRPRLGEEWELKQGFLTSANGTYGISRGGDFDGLRVQDLEQRLVPGGKHDPHGKRRLVFVGDIHGCADELKKLLKHVNFDQRTDHLIAVGDVISKGPDNVGVLDELMRIGASSVRGNHEDRILAMAPSILGSELDLPAAEMSSKGAAKDAALLRQLSKHHIRYLREMPLLIRIPALQQAVQSSHKSDSPLAEEILVVHAGLVPAVPLKKQDPYFVMNMRSILSKTHLPLAEAEDKKGKSRPWHDIWGWYNDRLFRHKSLKGFRVWDTEANTGTESWFSGLWNSRQRIWPEPQVVVYGHHSKAGLQLNRWSKGLDTGCVRGGQLTALVLDARGKHEIVQVGCKDHRD